MENFKNAVKNAIELYAETSGMSIEEVGKWFLESAECQENIALLVAMQANTLPYAERAI